MDERTLAEILLLAAERDDQASLELACVFHAKVDTDSAANWTLIPRETGQGFQGKLDT